MPTLESNYFKCITEGITINDANVQKLQEWACKYNHLNTYSVLITPDGINHYFECLVPKMRANFQKLIKNALGKDIDVTIISPKEFLTCDGTLIFKKAGFKKNLQEIEYDQHRTLSKTLLDTAEIQDGIKTVYTRWNRNPIKFKKELNVLYFSFGHKLTELKFFGVRPCDVSKIQLTIQIDDYTVSYIPLQWNSEENCWIFNIHKTPIDGLATKYCLPFLIYMEPSSKNEYLNSETDYRIECKGPNGEAWTLNYLANRYIAYTSGAVESILCKIHKLNESEPAEVAVYIDGRLYKHYVTNKNAVMIEFRQPDTPVEFHPEIYTPLSVLDHGTEGTKQYTREMMSSSINMYRTNMQIGVKNCSIDEMVEGAFVHVLKEEKSKSSAVF